MKGMYEKEIRAKIKKLPEDARNEAMDFIEFLAAKHRQREIGKMEFKFDWEGGLSNIKEKLTSVELQHKASGWR